MAQGRRPAVSLQVCREWLRRYEQSESPPEIAKTEGYDVRTVRKCIQVAREEREQREARTSLLKNGLEMHQADLIAFVKKLDQEIVHADGRPIGLRGHLLWQPLREHMPRARLWDLCASWDQLQGRRARTLQEISEHIVRITGEIKMVPVVHQLEKEGLLEDKLVGLVNWWIMGRAQGRQLDSEPITAAASGLDHVIIQCGVWTCGRVPKGKQKGVIDWLHALRSQVSGWPETEAMTEIMSKTGELTKKIRDELAVITYRHIIPGHCSLCPF